MYTDYTHTLQLWAGQGPWAAYTQMFGLSQSLQGLGTGCALLSQGMHRHSVCGSLSGPLRPQTGHNYSPWGDNPSTSDWASHMKSRTRASLSLNLIPPPWSEAAWASPCFGKCSRTPGLSVWPPPSGSQALPGFCHFIIRFWWACSFGLARDCPDWFYLQKVLESGCPLTACNLVSIDLLMAPTDNIWIVWPSPVPQFLWASWIPV